MLFYTPCLTFVPPTLGARGLRIALGQAVKLYCSAVLACSFRFLLCASWPSPAHPPPLHPSSPPLALLLLLLVLPFVPPRQSGLGRPVDWGGPWNAGFSAWGILVELVGGHLTTCLELHVFR